jgi:hypothetical protein
MPSGNPNPKKNNFTVRVYTGTDSTGKPTYSPAYIAPDATDAVYGDVLLSDSTSSSLNAATGVTAATPAAVKAANDNANTRLSRTSIDAQTVASPITFNSTVTTIGRLTASGGITGNVSGNASTATALQNANTIKVTNGSQSGSATFVSNGGTTTVNLAHVDASTLTGTVPTGCLPNIAKTTMVSVADKATRFKLTTSDVQNGDVVYQKDNGVMYLVVDESYLSTEQGYQPYKSDTAVTASHLTSSSVGSSAKPIFLSGGSPVASSSTIGSATQPIYMSGGTLTAGAYTINKSVPSDAVFTDHTYGNMIGASSSANGASGLVPAPTTSNVNQFLRGDGSWATPSGNVTSVNGSTGAVSLNAGSVGALSSGGGTVSGDILPATTNKLSLGSDNNRWNSIKTGSLNASGAIYAGSLSLGAALPIASGGTGATTAAAARTALGAAAASHTHAATDISSGTLSADRLPVVPISCGGTGATSVAEARGKLRAAALDHSHSASDITSGTLSSDRLPKIPISNGGTGATSVDAALWNLSAGAKILYNTGTWLIQAFGKLVVINLFDGYVGNSDSWATFQCPYVIPSGYRPPTEVSAALVTRNGSSWSSRIHVGTSGGILIENLGNNGAAEERSGCVVYVAA